MPNWVNSVRRLLRRITLIAAQNEEDGASFCGAGRKNNQVTVTGSLKFDISVTPQLAAKAVTLRRQSGTTPPGMDCHQHSRRRRECGDRRTSGIVTAIPEFIAHPGTPSSRTLPGCD
ncbi:hypothetical protein O5624_05325 [Escherichia coli]|nr:hypothetical protein [Escherichia coli]